MRHAAGERSDGLHLLRVTELFLEVSLLGDVEPRSHDVRSAGRVVVGHDPLVVAYPAIATILVPEAVLAHAVRSRLGLGLGFRQVVGVDVPGPPSRRERLGEAVAEKVRDVLADPREPHHAVARREFIQDGAARRDHALETARRRRGLADLGLELPPATT